MIVMMWGAVAVRAEVRRPFILLWSAPGYTGSWRHVGDGLRQRVAWADPEDAVDGV